ncbi:MAG: hypothetical protein CME11_08080 [Gemmatimonadetes bacterium]|nr:hypothetical protein [Gemmatimonadota bacterium]
MLEMLLLRISYVDRTVKLEELLAGLGGTPPPEVVPRRPSSGGVLADDSFSGPSTDTEEVAPRMTGEVPAPEMEEETSAQKQLPGALGAAEAWVLLVEEGADVPSGMRPFLRAATVSDSESEGVVVIELPAGPGLERLEDPSARRGLQKALGGLMHAEPEIVFQASGDGAPARSERISPETVQKDRMKGLIKREPRLQHAVEELDLELLD